MDTFYNISRMNRFFAWTMILIVVLVLYSFLLDLSPSWKTYQKEYYQLLDQRRKALALSPEFKQALREAQAQVKEAESRVDKKALKKAEEQLKIISAAYEKTLKSLRAVDAEKERLEVQLAMFVPEEEVKKAKKEYKALAREYKKALAQLGSDKFWYQRPLLWLEFHEKKGHYEEVLLLQKKTKGKDKTLIEKEYRRLSQVSEKLTALFDRLAQAQTFLQNKINKLNEEVYSARSKVEELQKIIREEKRVIRVRQILLPHLEAQKVDRCTTCHLGIENPLMAGNVPQPFRKHPEVTEHFLEKHPFDKMGCTICHMGQGRGTTASTAHGKVKHWEEPLLPRGYTQMQCFQCHSYVNPPEGTEIAQKGKKLFETRGCGGCHKIDGLSSGEACPDLNTEGDKLPKLYSYLHIRGEQNPINWHLQHFLDPARVSPGTKMPNLGLTPEEALALTTFVLSLKERTIPDAFTAFQEGETLFTAKNNP